jgi:hypothetical protein
MSSHTAISYHIVFSTNLFSSATAAKTSSAYIWGIFKNHQSYLCRINGDNAASSCSRRDIDDLIEYIKRQKEHHRKTTSRTVPVLRELSGPSGAVDDLSGFSFRRLKPTATHGIALRAIREAMGTAIRRSTLALWGWPRGWDRSLFGAAKASACPVSSENLTGLLTS